MAKRPEDAAFDRVQLTVDGPELTAAGVVDEVSREYNSFSPVWKAVMGVLGFLLVVGAVALVLRFVDGYGQNHRDEWGYVSATFAFLLITAGSAPLVAVVLRWTKNHWRRGFSRVSEMYAVVGLLTLLLMLPVMFLLPPLEGRRSLWVSDEFIGVPLWWDFISVLALVICGLGLLLYSVIPDLATLAARFPDSRRAAFLRPLAGWWHGTQAQWHTHRLGLTALGAFYFMLLIIVQTMINVDFVMSLVPGWKDAIMPAHQALTGLQTAIGLTLIGAFILRATGWYRDLIPMESFWSFSKILLAVSLLWAYFWFASFITFWYGRTPTEQNILKTFMVESYLLAFLANFILSFLAPFLILMWNPVRKTIIGPTIASVSVVLGALFMSIRLYVPPFTLEEVTGHAFHVVPPAVWPDALDIFIMLGAVSGAALIYLAAAKLFPIMSLWEMREGLLYHRVRPLLRGKYLVLGKPE